MRAAYGVCVDGPCEGQYHPACQVGVCVSLNGHVYRSVQGESGEWFYVYAGVP